MAFVAAKRPNPYDQTGHHRHLKQVKADTDAINARTLQYLMSNARKETAWKGIDVPMLDEKDLTPCYKCQLKRETVLCTNCSNAVCEPCSSICERCRLYFCSFCSTNNYDEEYERLYCLDCSDLVAEEARKLRRSTPLNSSVFAKENYRLSHSLGDLPRQPSLEHLSDDSMDIDG